MPPVALSIAVNAASVAAPVLPAKVLMLTMPMPSLTSHFTGRSSILYHVTPPTQTHKIEPVRRIAIEAADDGLHRHRLTKTGGFEPSGDAISGRVPLYFNSDVIFGIVRPAEPKVAFEPSGINLYAGSWRVEMGA